MLIASSPTGVEIRVAVIALVSVAEGPSVNVGVICMNLAVEVAGTVTLLAGFITVGTCEVGRRSHPSRTLVTTKDELICVNNSNSFSDFIRPYTF